MHRSPFAGVIAFAGVLSMAVTAQGQPPGAVQVQAATGGCQVRVIAGAAATAPREFVVRLNNYDVKTLTIEAGRTEGSVTLDGPLDVSETITVREGQTDYPTTERLPKPATGSARCPSATAGSDGRDGFGASFYIGGAVDNFAPSQVGNYVEDPTLPNKTRWIGGIDFEYRVGDRADRDVQLWIAGQTLHGVRTADVNCTAAHAPPICKNDPVSLGEAGSTLRYILKNATSLEAFIAPRLELYTFNRNSENAAAKLYVATRFGLIGLSDAPKSFAAHHFSVGLTSLNGSFDGSALEIGWGSNDLFERPPGRSRYYRMKLDALLSMDIIPEIIKNATGSPRPFIQFYLDNDVRGPGADSIQTFFGLDFKLGRR